MAHRGDFHSFSTLVAKQCGVNAAIVLRHLDFWIVKNRANKENFRDGRYWTYSSMNGFCEILDYLSPKQIRTAIEKLEQEGYIIRGNYNSSGYDRKTWYAITEAGYAAFGVGGGFDPGTASDESLSSDEQGKMTDEAVEESVPVCPDGSIAAAAESIPFAAEGKSICPDGQMELPLRANGFAAEGKSIRGEDIATDVATDNIPPNPPKGGTGEAAPAFGQSPGSEKPKRGKRGQNPARSPELAPEEEAALFAVSPRLCGVARDWFRYRSEIRKPFNTPTGRRQFIRRVLDSAQQYGPDAVATLIDRSMSSGYQGVIWGDLPGIARGGGNGTRDRPSWEEIAENVAKGMKT